MCVLFILYLLIKLLIHLGSYLFYIILCDVSGGLAFPLLRDLKNKKSILRLDVLMCHTINLWGWEWNTELKKTEFGPYPKIMYLKLAKESETGRL